MKFKMALRSLVLVLISTSALGAGAPTDEFFFPGGWWQGTYESNCNGDAGPGGTAKMYVSPLSIADGNPGIKNEYFVGTVILENLPTDCLNIDFSAGVPLTKESYAEEEADIPNGNYNLIITAQTKTGTMTYMDSYWNPNNGNPVAHLEFDNNKMLSSVWVTLLAPS